MRCVAMIDGEMNSLWSVAFIQGYAKLVLVIFIVVKLFLVDVFSK